MTPEKGYEIMNQICCQFYVHLPKEMQDKFTEARNAVLEIIPKDSEKEKDKKVN